MAKDKKLKGKGAAPIEPANNETTNNASLTTTQSNTTKTNRTSWTGGSWRGKASAVAEIAKESISGNTAADIASRSRDAVRSPSQRLSLSLGTNGKSKASPAIATPLTVTSDAASDDKSDGKSEKKEKSSGAKAGEASSAREAVTEKVPTEPQKEAAASKDGAAESHPMQERPMPAAGWRGWWTRPRQETDDTSKPGVSETQNRKDLPGIPDPAAASVHANQKIDAKSEHTPGQDSTQQAKEPQDAATDKSPKQNRSSWFGLWGSANLPEEDDPSSLERRPSGTKGLSVEPSATNVEASSEPSKGNGETVKTQLTSRPASGSWAFWSRERPTSKDDTDKSNKKESKGEVGELAVTGTESQSKPRPAQLSEKDEASKQDASKKRQRPESADAQQSSSKKTAAGKQVAKSADSKSDSQSDGDVPSTMQQSVLMTSVQPPKEKKREPSKAKDKPIVVPPQNAIFPTFEDTYPTYQQASYLTRLSRYIPYTAASSAPKHLYRSQQPHRIRRALAIGVHGYFPAAIFQKVLGAPTGTSIKFADSAAAAIQQHCSLHAYNAEIEKVALEGEGTIEQRIENLWKLLLNWIEAIRRSDFIFVACHSQGVPVAVGLVARLLSFGCVQKDARVGICAMAGINQGPFSSYQSRFLPQGSSAAELFQFSQPSSSVSLGYANALNTCMRHNVRVLYVGSLDDQLVSLESSTHGIATHPYISRAVFVDGREHPHTADFLTRLVGFALRLRNMGISDHGLIRELSMPLAGSLYTGEGHSRIYEEEAVYDMAVRLTAETETLDHSMNPNLDVNKKVPDPAEVNPFFLPWALRGVLEEEEVKKNMKKETEELLGLFEKWRPQSKTLKDVRFRLEAVRSKL